MPLFLGGKFPFAPDDDPAEPDEKFVVPTIGEECHWGVRSRHTGSVHYLWSSSTLKGRSTLRLI